MSAPSICVALSVRNGGAYLAEAIESVLAQQDVDLELRIYDNGSTDDSFAVYARYAGDRVIVARNPEGCNFYDSMNRALRETAAPWLVPWCADDVMLPRSCADKLEAAERTGASFAFGPAIGIDAEGRRYPMAYADEGPRELVFDAPELFPRIRPSNNVVISGLLLGCTAARDAGGFDPVLVLCADWMMWLRLALRVRGVYVPEPGVLYREHQESTTSSSRRAGTFAPELMRVLRTAYGDPLLPPAWRAGLTDDLVTVLCGQASAHTQAGVLRLQDGEHPAYALLLEALLLDPHRASTLGEYLVAVRSAGLPQTRVPLQIVATPAPAVDELAAALRAIRALAAAPGLVGRAQVATVPDALDAMVELIEADLAANGDLDIELSVTPDAFALLRPGDVLVTRSGDPRALEAERVLGATVLALPAAA